MFASQFAEFNVACEALSDMDEARWRCFLKLAGVYRAEDRLDFDGVFDVYVQALCQLRDQAAPPGMLRRMRQVPRSSPRLKDRYDMFEFRAKDSLGKVYRCRDVQTKEARACRQIRKDRASAPIDQIRESLVRLRQLRHPNVPPVYEHLEDFHNFYVVSAPTTGGELMDCIQDSYVQAQGLSEAWVADIARELLETLAHCHSQRPAPMFHRDLRPESILLDVPVSEGDRPKISIVGFGLQVLFDKQDVGSVLPPDCLPTPLLSSLDSLPTSGMPELLAPEVWRREAGPRCDIWACGCILFLLLTGRLPFGPGLPLKDLLHAISSEEPDWRLFRHASTSALSLCRRMLQKDDSARPSAAECLRHPWLEVSRGADRVPRPLRPETLGSLLQLHAQAKFHQVLMNVVAAELKVSRIRAVRPTLAELDEKGTGLLSHGELEVALARLGVSSHNISQVIGAMDFEKNGRIPYVFFMAGCVELVDDKLDFMLWKLFSMVDEDHSGEISTVELEHFFVSAWDDSGSARSRDDGSSGVGHVEQYLRSVLDLRAPAAEVVRRIAAGQDVATFEAIKRFLLECGGTPAGERHEVEDGSRQDPQEGTGGSPSEELSTTHPGAGGDVKHAVNGHQSSLAGAARKLGVEE